MQDTPKVGFMYTGITFKSVLKPGRVYTVEWNSENNYSETLSACYHRMRFPSYALKAIYPHRQEQYNEKVHQIVAQAGYAPCYIATFAYKPHTASKGPMTYQSHYMDTSDTKNKSIGKILQSLDGNNRVEPLVRWLMMQYLTAPIKIEEEGYTSEGWVTLADLADDYEEAAGNNKSLILEEISKVLNILKENSFVHGDLRPNNILVYVKLKYNNEQKIFSCSLLPRS